ncbi:hypothetical protein FCH31_12915 [Lelliottia amnigena]|nr:SEC-C metal-binding domain-containing protein [Lelliottia amnigena]NTX70319.1 hypothetical protein [Lelliottia amnigena]
MANPARTANLDRGKQISPSRKSSKIDSNVPYPCGSSMKYERCHGR